MPFFTITAKEIDDQLDELKTCFDMKKISIDGTGQEFLYAVSKRFGAVFNSQSEAMKFHPYQARDEKVL